jgi:excisionase family DNA binding protein
MGSLLTVGEAAELLGVSASTIRNWDRSGKLKAIRHPVNNYRLYDRYELEILLGQIMPNNSSETRNND